MKSIHFTQVPTMRGKKTKRVTDLVAENFREKLEDERRKREIIEYQKSLSDDDIDAMWGGDTLTGVPLPR